MTTPDPITTAREAALELRQIACLLNDDQAQTGVNFDRETAITAALDYAEKLKAERDEAIFERDFYKTNLELADNHAKEVLRPEITRLTSQLEQAERVIKPFAEVVKSMHAGMSYHSTIVPAKYYFAASQWIKDRQATLSKGITE